MPKAAGSPSEMQTEQSLLVLVNKQTVGDVGEKGFCGWWGQKLAAVVQGVSRS